jgi:uncharacterized membrane protein
MSLAYLVLKSIHVLAVVIFLGNITVGLFWKNFADRTKNAAIIAHTLDGIIRADRIFTIPAIFVVLAGGLGAAGVARIPILSTGWILWPIVLFIISGIAFAPVSRLQRQLLEVAQQGVASGRLDFAQYDRLSRGWDIWGSIALIAPFIAAVIMIVKPGLPSFHSQ